MATRPDITAFITHEERVRAFMASVSSQRKRRVEAKFPLIEDRPQLELDYCDPAVFDLVDATGLPVHRSRLRSVPDHLEEA